MNMFKRLMPILISLLISSVACAEEITGDVTGNVLRSIKLMGCHLNDATCYIDVDEAVGIDGQCKGKSVRWFKDAENGKEILSMFLAAQLASKQVSLNISTDCFAGAGNYPTFRYMSIRN